jgi:drug/metabolite transporter (DMT)-like permease
MINKPLAVNHDCPASTGLLPLAAGLCGALMNLASRSLKEVSPPVLCLFNDVVAVVFGWVWIGYRDLPMSKDNDVWVVGLMVLSAVLGWAGLMANIKGYQSVSFVGLASIAGYSAIPFGYVSQVLLFHQVPDLLSVIGALLVLGISVYTAVEKIRAAKKQSSTESKMVGEEPDKGYRELASEAQGA